MEGQARSALLVARSARNQQVSPSKILLAEGVFAIHSDGFRESIIRLGVKVDNGLEKLNQGLKKAEKVKNSDQTSESNLRARYTLTTARGAR